VDVSAALDAFAGAPVDAIVLTRGGGSYEDLFTFNREAVVRAIVRSKLPVITAIGHSYDHHLADEVADVYYGTPSLAAEAISKGWMVAIGRLQNARNDLRRAWRDLAMQRAQRLSEARSSLTRCALRIVNDKGTALARCDVRLERCNPHSRLAAQRGTVHALAARSRAAYSATVARKHTLWNARADRLDRSIGAMHAAALRRIERAQAGLVACDPLSPLSRGYAIVTYAGKALRDARSVAPGEAIEARVERGMLVARVESVTDDD
jgi:exodeoxyribonuclease VII large subunit